MIMTRKLLFIGVAALAIGQVAARPSLSKQVAVPRASTAEREKSVRSVGVSPDLKTSTAGSMSAPTADADFKNTAKIGSLIGLWYILNIFYNIENKKTLNLIQVPWILASYQLLVGVVWVLPLWALRIRKAPKLTSENIKNLFPIGMCHMVSHASAVIGLGAGAVSFVHIVKAMEPFFTALFSAMFLKQFLPAPVYATLIPVVGGVALASFKELDFKWAALGGAMGSNVAAAMRGIFAKQSMGRPMGENMNAANLYAVLTIIATTVLIPIAAAIEGPRFKGLWIEALLKCKAAHPLIDPKVDILRGATLSGLFFYLYNEVAFLALDKVHPVTHAVANTIKRVFIIATSVLFFKHQLTPLSIVGSALAIGGVLLYSLVKEHYQKKGAENKVNLTK